MTKRYEYCVNEADCYRIADMTNCKTLEQFIEDVKKEHHEWYTEEEIKELAKDEYADYIYNHGLEGYEVIDKLNEQDQRIQELEDENQHYKHLFQDLGLLMTDEDVMDIRTEIADKFIKPLFEENGFDVDVDCYNGFTIIPKGDV